MPAKRASIMLAEIEEHIRANGAHPSDWRVTVTDMRTLQDSSGIAHDQPESCFREAYSARDAHEVALALTDIGCLEDGSTEDESATVVVARLRAALATPMNQPPVLATVPGE
jgi:hypothetical protein